MNNYGYYPFHQGMPMQPGQMMPDGDRIFLAPFLLGGLGGAALVGLSRPRPVYVTGGPAYYPYPPRPYGGGGYGYNYYY